MRGYSNPNYKQRSNNPHNYTQNSRALRNRLEDEFMNDFNFGIQEDFDDPFDQIMGNFGFPNINQIQQRIFGNFNNALMQLGDNFENNNNNLQRNNNTNFNSMFAMQNIGPGTMISKSYCSKVDYRDGKPHQECYQSQSIKQVDNQGHKISEKQEAYKNSRTGIQKAAHQRLLDDKGTKQIRQRNVNTGFQEEHNIYKGIKEDELDNFNKNYNEYRNKVGFQNNYKYLNALNDPSKRRRSQNYLGNGRRNNNNQNNLLKLGDGNNNYNEQKKYGKQRRK